MHNVSGSYPLFQPHFGMRKAKKTEHHVHGAHCHHEHTLSDTRGHHHQSAPPRKKHSRNPLISLWTGLQNAVQTVLKWIRELFTGLYTDIKILVQGPQQETPHVHGPHCNHEHHHHD